MIIGLFFCELCSGPHSTFECPYGNLPVSSYEEQMNFVNNDQWDNQGPHSDTYNPEWYHYEPPHEFQEQGPVYDNLPQQNQSRFEEFMMNFMQETQTQMKSQ